jgi:hypothetical protein
MIRFVQDVSSINLIKDARDNYNGNGEAPSFHSIRESICKSGKKSSRKMEKTASKNYSLSNYKKQLKLKLRPILKEYTKRHIFSSFKPVQTSSACDKIHSTSIQSEHSETEDTNINT